MAVMCVACTLYLVRVPEDVVHQTICCHLVTVYGAWEKGNSLWQTCRWILLLPSIAAPWKA